MLHCAVARVLSPITLVSLAVGIGIVKVKDRWKTDRSMGILWMVDVLWKASRMLSGHFIILFLKMTLTIKDKADTIHFISFIFHLSVKGILDIISFNQLGASKNIKQKENKTTTPYSYFWLGRLQFPLCTIFSKIAFLNEHSF